MNKRGFWALVSLALTGCPGAPDLCDPLADRTGVFEATYEAIPGGTCGPVPGSWQVHLDELPALDCVDAAEASGSECAPRRQLECVTQNGQRVTVESTSRPVASGFAGYQLVTQYAPDGSELCQGGYLVSYERQ